MSDSPTEAPQDSGDLGPDDHSRITRRGVSLLALGMRERERGLL